jgi:hypothetical protein
VLEDGSAAATNGVCQAFFPPDIYNGSIQIESAGATLSGQPQCLTYSDGTNYVVLGVLTNSVGELVSSNELLYPGAISGPGVEADLMMTYRRSGIEQDVIFRAKPPTPEQFGLTSASTRLQLLTEFSGGPAPQATAEPINSRDGLQDTTLTFGNIRMIQGRAFLIGNNQQNNIQFQIFKSWQVVDANTAVLVEQLPYSQIAASLATLPPPTAARPMHSRLRKIASEWTLPKKTARIATTKVRVARIKQRPGFTLDYITINGQSLTNYVFTGDNLFFVSGPVYLYGTTVLEGGSVIKANTNGVINIEAGGTVDCKTGPYLPAIVTSYNDNAVGYGIGSGSPVMGDANIFLNFYSTNVVLHDLHFAYALNAVNQTSPGSAGSIDLWDSEFVDVDTAVTAYNVGLYNVLIGRTALTNAAVIVDGAGLVGENVTADYGNEFIQPDTGATIALTNCLVTGQPLLTPGSSVTLQTNTVVCLPAPSAPVYQVVGGGNYYLTNGSPYTTAGTTNINPDLLSDLQQKTVWPPTVYADTNISSLGTLGPSVPRDINNFAAIGFHYDHLDYVFGGADLYSNLTVTTGTAIGWFEEAGGVSTSGQPYSMTLNPGATLVFNGTATQPCYWSQYAMVQERGNNNWNGSGYMGSFTFNGSDSSPEPLLTANFTKFTVGNIVILVRDNSGPGAGIFKNCEFYNDTIGTFDLTSLTFTNCLFFRDCMDFWAGDAIDFTNDNCTYYNGGLALSRTTSDNPSFWSIENTIFDGTLLCFYDPYNGSSTYTAFNYNAYNTNNLSWQTYGFPYSNWLITNILENPGPNEVFTNNFNWECSWFGNFYLPSDSSLIEAGSTNANFLGLYHFTTQTNQDIEGDSLVDIGYHYVATDQYGNPLDNNGDGIPDYLEDANGNGLVDSGEIGWNIPGDLGLSVIITQPRNGSTLP